MVKNRNISWHPGLITREDREKILKQKGLVLWFYGLSGSGKSTIAVELEKELTKKGKLVYRLDGDNIRHGLNTDLGFSLKDRAENLRRIAEVAKLLADCGIIVLCSFITPLKSYREMIRKILGDDLKFIFVKTSLKECIKRDPKNLYQKAMNGEIGDFTGISAPFEEDDKNALEINTEKSELTDCVKSILEKIR